jgi:amino acid transporter
MALSLSLTIINLLGVRDAAAASNLFAVGKMAPLVLFIAVGVFFVDPQRLLITRGASYGALSLSVLLLVHTFTGFESVGIAAGEVRDPQRSVPFALFSAIGAITLMYLLIQAVCIGTLPELASSTRPLADAGTLFLGSAGGYLIALGAIISIAGNLSGQLLVTPRTIFAMAERRQLPQAFALVHPRFRTPYVSILSSAAVILGFALSGTFIQLATISVLSRVAVYAITCLALPVLRRNSNQREPSFKVPLGNVIAIAAFLVCLWMLSSSTKGGALMTTIAAAVGLLLYLAYKVRTARQSKALRA